MPLSLSLSLILSIMVMGAMAIIVLAWYATWNRRQRLKQHLHGQAHFSEARWLYRHGTGLVLDRIHERVSTIADQGSSISLDALPWDCLLAVELLMRTGEERRWLRQDTRIEQAVQAYVDSHPLLMSRKDTACAYLRLLTNIRGRAQILIPLYNQQEVQVWQSECRLWLSTLDQQAALKLREQTRQPQSRPVQDPDTLAYLVERLRHVFDRQFAHARRFVLPERQLRDRTGLDLPIIHFHECLNRLKRQRALAPFRLAYSRKDESWRISRTA